MILSENRKTTFRDHAVCWGSRPPPVPPVGAGTDRFCGRFRRKPRVRNTARAFWAREVAGF